MNPGYLVNQDSSESVALNKNPAANQGDVRKEHNPGTGDNAEIKSKKEELEQWLESPFTVKLDPRFYLTALAISAALLLIGGTLIGLLLAGHFSLFDSANISTQLLLDITGHDLVTSTVALIDVVLEASIYGILAVMFAGVISTMSLPWFYKNEIGKSPEVGNITNKEVIELDNHIYTMDVALRSEFNNKPKSVKDFKFIDSETTSKKIQDTILEPYVLPRTIKSELKHLAKAADNFLSDPIKGIRKAFTL